MKWRNRKGIKGMNGILPPNRDAIYTPTHSVGIENKQTAKELQRRSLDRHLNIIASKSKEGVESR
jgi:hypothetical protein